MKNYIIVSFLVILNSFLTNQPVTNDLSQAKELAKKEHKLILLKFSGSDWCVPCINIQKKVIDTEDFQTFAKNNLILMDADFPRQKKNKLSEENQKKNKALAELYDKDGIFPKMLLLDENGKILAHWEGLKKLDPKYLKDEILPYLDKN